MSPSLSNSPDLAQIKRQAKELLKAQKGGDIAVCNRLRKVHRFADLSDQEILASEVKLAETQHAIAKDYGFNTWSDMKAYVETQLVAHDSGKANRRDALADVSVRRMVKEDIPALRQFDDELAAELPTTNEEHPPDGYQNDPGGPWSDDQWLLDHFMHYESTGNTILIAETSDHRIVGFADLWLAAEPDPFGPSMNIEAIDSFREHYLAGLETRLLSEAEAIARDKGVAALDIGTNTCGSDFISLRRFGLRVFYEYDNLTCKCATSLPKVEHKRLVASGLDMSRFIKVNHWSPTDFAFRAADGPTYVAEFTVGDTAAIVELWHHNPNGENLPVPENAPNDSELFVEPGVLSSPELMSEVLLKSTRIAAELGADIIQLSCPSDIGLDESRLDIIKREFAFAWLRKKLL